MRIHVSLMLWYDTKQPIDRHKKTGILVGVPYFTNAYMYDTRAVLEKKLSALLSPSMALYNPNPILPSPRSRQGGKDGAVVVPPGLRWTGAYGGLRHDIQGSFRAAHERGAEEGSQVGEDRAGAGTFALPEGLTRYTFDVS